MTTRRQKAITALGAAIVLIYGLRTVAQEAEKAKAAKPAAPKTAESNASLLAADREVIDATSAVTKTVKAATPAEQVPVDAPRGFVPPDLGNYQVTVFADGYGLVRRVENVDLVVGRNEFTVKQIARNVAPSSARLRPLDDPARFTVLEQSGGAPRDAHQLLAEALGKDVRVRDGNYTVAGKLVSVDADGVVVAGDNEVHLHPKGEVILPGGVPDLAPTLAWLVETSTAGQVPAEVTYLTDGLTWSADYAVTMLPKQKLVSFDGWVSLENTCGIDLDAVGCILSDETSGLRKPEPAKPGEPAPKAAVEPGNGKRFYLPRKVSLANGHDRRFVLAQATGARGAMRYVANLGPDGLTSLRSAVQLVNNAAAGMGVPLPPGPVRLYAPDALGRLQLVGRQTLAATDPDQPLTFELGGAEGVSATVETAGEDGAVRRTVHLRNQRAEEITVRLVEKRPAGWQLLQASSTFGAVNDGTASSEVTVPANGSLDVRYQIRPATGGGATTAAATTPAPRGRTGGV